jgi:hypothetical protein
MEDKWRRVGSHAGVDGLIRKHDWIRRHVKATDKLTNITVRDADGSLKNFTCAKEFESWPGAMEALEGKGNGPTKLEIKNVTFTDVAGYLKSFTFGRKADDLTAPKAALEHTTQCSLFFDRPSAEFQGAQRQTLIHALRVAAQWFPMKRQRTKVPGNDGKHYYWCVQQAEHDAVIRVRPITKAEYDKD